VEATSTDSELLAGCREGDPRGWEILVERYSGYVYAIVCRGFRLSGHDAEDVFQEVFARLFENVDKLRDDSALRFWIGQTTRRLAIDRLRQTGREAPSIEADGLPEPAQPDQLLERLDTAIALRGEVDALSENCREIILRFFIRDQSYSAIAEDLDIPAGTIASRISRCLETLRERMSTEESSAAGVWKG
jgi:RNA polymerase sigma-70 factor (ECF subfamily)